MRATNKDAQRRYASAAEMLADLDALARAHGGDLDRGVTAQMPGATPMANVPTAMSPSPGTAPLPSPPAGGTAFAPAPQYASAAPYLPASPQLEPARSSSGGSGVVVGVLVALLLVGGVGSGVGYYLYARGHGSSPSSDDDDKPTKTKDKDKPLTSKHASDDDDDDESSADIPSAKVMRRRFEGEGYTVAGDNTSHSQGMQLLVLTGSRGSEAASVYLYVFDDPKMADSVESAMGKTSGMVSRRKGGVIYMAFSSLGRPSAKALLDAVFPP
jgi:hypothetical protein